MSNSLVGVQHLVGAGATNGSDAKATAEVPVGEVEKAAPTVDTGIKCDCCGAGIARKALAFNSDGSLFCTAKCAKEGKGEPIGEKQIKCACCGAGIARKELAFNSDGSMFCTAECVKKGKGNRPTADLLLSKLAPKIQTEITGIRAAAGQLARPVFGGSLRLLTDIPPYLVHDFVPSSN